VIFGSRDTSDCTRGSDVNKMSACWHRNVVCWFFISCVISNVVIKHETTTVQALCSISIIFTCPGYWKSRGILCGLESGHPVSVCMSTRATISIPW